MNRALLYLLASGMLAPVHATAAPEPLNNMGEPFYSKGIRIVWNLRTNPLPATIKLFEVLPRAVSPGAISNLLSICELSTNDFEKPAAGALAPLVFRKGDASLSIDPQNSAISYYTIDRNHMWPTNVPDRARGFELATKLCARIEIPLSDFLAGTNDQPRPWFYPGTMGRFDKEMRKFVEAPHTFGVEFRRQLDGIPCFLEKAYMQFESEEKLTELEVTWHQLKPSKPFAVATTDQIAQWIREGRARVQSLAVAGPGGRNIRPADIRRISVGEIVLHYAGATYHRGHKFEESSARYLYPYAVLSAEAELGPNDKELIFLFAPVTAEALTSISRKHDRYGFGIYPSRRFGPPAKGE